MLDQYQKLIYVISKLEQVRSRKRLQKMVYIARYFGFPLYSKFAFHHYGPYSQELTLKIVELCDLGFIEERIIVEDFYKHYTYRVSDEGEKLIEDITYQDYDSLFFQLNKQSTRNLELISSILFFNDLSKEETLQKITLLKKEKNYQQVEFTAAFHFIEKLISQGWVSQREVVLTVEQ